MVLHLKKNEGCLVPNLDESAQGFWTKRFLNIFSITLHICYNLPLKKGVAFYLNKNESSPSKNALCHVWLKFAKRFWRKRLLNIFKIIKFFHYYLPLDKGVALYLNKLESPPSNDALCHVCRNWPSGSEQKYFLIFSI